MSTLQESEYSTTSIVSTLRTRKRVNITTSTITLYYQPGGDIWKEFLLESSIPEYNILGETIIIADDFDHFVNMTKHDVMSMGTHANMAAYLGQYTLSMSMGRWHRSEEKVAGFYPYGGYLTNKKWTLNEVKVKDD